MDYIFGYGSLLSEYSRQHYSNIESTVIPATLNGWLRAWCTSYPDEGATYAGAQRGQSHHLDGVLIPSEIDQQIANRERGYCFTQVSMNDLLLTDKSVKLTARDNIWICESLVIDVANSTNPLPQSYVDTCMSGCIESWGLEGAKRFIEQTQGWDCVWVNDRNLEMSDNKKEALVGGSSPIYPRYTPISEHQMLLIDTLLEEQGVLQHRVG